MRKRFRSLLIERADLKIPGLHVKQFAVHRHLPELTQLQMHEHAWTQVLLYLDGQGTQRIGLVQKEVLPGAVFVIPPRVPHAFVRSGRNRPLCVMIDLDLRRPTARKADWAYLGRSELMEVRQRLASLLTAHSVGDRQLRLDSAVFLLQILQVVLRSTSRGEAAPPRTMRRSGDRALHELIAQMQVTEPLKAVVERSGYQEDHFNRLLKQKTGLTLGQHRSRQRLKKAKTLLAQGHLISSAATLVGLLDQAYFTRWFRKQTGLTPSQWRLSTEGARYPRDGG